MSSIQVNYYTTSSFLDLFIKLIIYQFKSLRYIALESCPYNLKDLVRGIEIDPLIGTKSQILHQIGSSLNYLHKMDIVHRDLRPSNIVVSKSFSDTPPRMKLTNFAYSRIP